jgi:hypothetical protein
MEATKLELMEKWDTIATLMGLNPDEIYDDYEDDDYFYELLSVHERHLERLANPSDMMKIVLLTNEMGITTDDVDDYLAHKERLQAEAMEAERQERIWSNPAITQLRETYNFKILEPKQYKNHTYFEFTTSNGIQVSGRMFMRTWQSLRVWLEWKPSTGGKRARFKWDLNYNALTAPKVFPQEWREYSYARNPTERAHVIAYNVIHKFMPKKIGFKYPV